MLINIPAALSVPALRCSQHVQWLPDTQRHTYEHQGTDNTLIVFYFLSKQQTNITFIKSDRRQFITILECTVYLCKYYISHLLPWLARQSWFTHLTWRTLINTERMERKKMLNDFGQKFKG